jgi:beta-glucosidase-like glycosyl hydrolase
VVSHNLTRLEAVELYPFKQAILADAPLLMSAHVVLPALDVSGLPGTLSRTIMDGLLRKRMGFKGVVVTDSLAMGAIHKLTTWQRIVTLSLHAGADILLYADFGGVNQVNFIRKYHRLILRLVAKGLVSEKRIDDSVMRVLKMKQRFGMLQSKPAASAGSAGSAKFPSEVSVDSASSGVGDSVGDTPESESGVQVRGAATYLAAFGAGGQVPALANGYRTEMPHVPWKHVDAPGLWTKVRESGHVLYGWALCCLPPAEEEQWITHA